MRLKPKFLDISMDDVVWDGGRTPVSSSGGTMSGLVHFHVPPCAAVGPPDGGDNTMATYEYAASKAASISGYAMAAFVVITPTHLSTKQAVFNVSVAPGLSGSVVGKMDGGADLAVGIDFDVLEDGSGITWDGYDLDGVVQENDVLRFVYKGSEGMV